MYVYIQHIFIHPTDARIDETAILMPTAREFFEAIPKGVGQPFAADSTAAGIVMIIGMLAYADVC
jgi:hypothetical protein